MEGQILKGDCLRLLAECVEDDSVSLVLFDPPYGTTANEWDRRLPLMELWPELWRVLRPRGAVLVFGQQPFTTMVGHSALRDLRYEWIWEKPRATGFLNARRAPLKAHENLLVFAKGGTNYHPQMTEGKPYKGKSGGQSSNYGTFSMSRGDNHGTRFPRSVLRVKHEVGLHPTQKPAALYEYMIRTDTEPDELVLDPCAGSGTAAVAAMRWGRRFTVIEKEPGYCKVMKQRIREEERRLAAAA